MTRSRPVSRPAMRRSVRPASRPRRAAMSARAARPAAGVSRANFLRGAGVGAAGLGAAMMGMGGVASAALPTTTGILAKVKKRGKLNVAIDGDGKPGFFDNGKGLEADLAKALAMAIFGPSGAGRINWIPTGSASRFYEVVTGNADICFRSCTWTTGRDAYQDVVGGYDVYSGVAFGPVYFYDGMDVLVNAATAPINTPLENMRIGVQAPSTTYNVLSVDFGLPLAGPTGPGLVLFESDTAKSDRNAAFNAGKINAMAGDSSDVGAYSSASTYLYFTYTTGQPYGKEPLAPFVAEGDENWRDVVDWTMFALFEAYEKGYNGDIPAPADWGFDTASKLGLNVTWAQDAISRGHYGDLFEDSLGVPPAGKNKLWLEGGLIYSPAFRK